MALANAVLILLWLCFLIPLSWLVLASLDPEAGYTTELPKTFTLDNFAAVLTPELAFVPLLNSLLLSAGAAALTVVAAVLAAYPLSRYQLRFNKPFLYTVLFGTCLPITAIMVPVYGLFVQLNLLDSLPATTFFMAATFLPMAIWMTKNFMDSVPISLEEAAWMDGASSMKALAQVVVPLMRPGLAVVFIFVFIQAWGNFFVPFILLLSRKTKRSVRTLAISSCVRTVKSSGSPGASLWRSRSVSAIAGTSGMNWLRFGLVTA